METESFSLQLRIDDQTGQILELRDPERGASGLIAAYEPGHEIEINGLPLKTRVVAVAEARYEHITTLAGVYSSAYGAGVRFTIRRVITCGGQRNHTGPVQSCHIRYEVLRSPNTVEQETLDYIWQPELEAPLRIERVGVLCAKAKWFGQNTRMRAIAIGGSGPREHVSIEDGKISEVVPYLQTGFRTCFPGQPTIAGALYCEGADNPNYTWMCVRRSSTGGRLKYDNGRHGVDFFYFTDMQVQQQIFTPAVSFLYGRGLEDADRALAAQFDRFYEPPGWWYNTTWFWLHPLWQTGGSFDAMAAGAETLADGCGVNGFGLCTHDIPWSGNDVDPGSLMPSPSMGGDEGLRRAVERIKAKGGRTYIWFTRTAHRPDQIAYQNDWSISGIDGRPVRIRNRPDVGVFADIFNPMHPGVEAHLFETIAYYVKVLGIDGIFWDSGFQPLPPDFSGRGFHKHPGESMSAYLSFYERVYRFGRGLSKDFFMWGEGLSVDVPMNGFAVDSRNHHGASGHRLMHRLAHAGPRRLVWRSAWAHDVASGMPFIEPFNDVHAPPTVAHYETIARNPMNRWICQTVKERGVRQAVGLADGVSLLDEYVIACPGISGAVSLPAAKAGGGVLENVLTKATVRGASAGGQVTFDLPASGAYRLKG